MILLSKYTQKSLALQAEDRENLKRLKELGDFFVEEYFYELKLTNKFDIRDLDELNVLERDVTFLKDLSLQKNPIKGNFDFEHLKKVHRFLFDDIYYFAGQTREMNMQSIQ